jgi:hypothetical protein
MVPNQDGSTEPEESEAIEPVLDDLEDLLAKKRPEYAWLAHLGASAQSKAP